MFYQLRVNIFFQERDALDDIIDKILDHFDDSVILNPGAENEELSTFDLIENHHDEDPNAPCFLHAHYDNSPPPPD